MVFAGIAEEVGWLRFAWLWQKNEPETLLLLCYHFVHCIIPEVLCQPDQSNELVAFN